MKKNLFFTVFLILLGLMGFSQSKFMYEYDANGNRTLRDVINMSRRSNIDSVVITKSYKLYPNPVEEHLTVEFEELDALGYTYTLIDINGRVIKEEVIIDRINKIDMSELSSGIYLLSVIAGGEKKEWKIVKK